MGKNTLSAYHDLHARLADWLADPEMNALHPGVSFPLKEKEIMQLMERMLAVAPDPSLEWKALIVPHVSFEMGLQAYGSILRQLVDHPPGGSVLVMGIAHKNRRQFVLANRPIRTPLGLVETDNTVTAQLRDCLGTNVELLQASLFAEHSLEFPVLLLQAAARLRGDQNPVNAVLLGCGNMEDEITADDPNAGEWAAFTSWLKAEIESESLNPSKDKELRLIGCIDGSHIGTRFGDRFTINDKVAKELHDFDRDLFTQCEEGRSDVFFNCISRNKNATRFDGVGILYALTTALRPRSRLEINHLDFIRDDAKNELVGYASGFFNSNLTC